MSLIKLRFPKEHESYYQQEDAQDALAFSPVFQDPFPICGPGAPCLEEVQLHSWEEISALRASRKPVETLTKFRARMSHQFKVQLKAYSELWQLTNDPESKPLLALHAQLTSLAFAGVSTADIARVPEFLNLKRSKKLQYKDPESTTSKAIARFAGSIGLTLPSERNSCLEEIVEDCPKDDRKRK